jgi:signal transduction histidine kinase/DNA-binding response OmpR family regulator
VVTDIRARLGPVFEPPEPAAEPSDSAMLLPLTDRVSGRPAGVLALGTSPLRAFDEEYRHFFELVARQVSTAVTDALVYESERRRVEALEALDQAKTRFLQNVSHEFHTPLTLVLGPLGETLRRAGADVTAEQRAALESAHRAALRLERLVTNLLQFARADGGSRVRREATDVAALTAECAAMFRSAIERAGLSLVVDIDEVPGPVELDQEMWVQILSNLLSNAVKFTAAGTITVRLRRAERDRVVLEVADTGAGIPAEEIPKVFARFHQVPDAVARTREGAGIGLSLVAEFVAQLGGQVDVVSTPGAGSTFTIRVPAAAATDPGAESAAAIALVRAAVSETDSWLDSVPEPLPGTAAPTPAAGTVLLVEDNADMRAHLARLLRDDGWTVDVVPDADQALERVIGADLVLSDVMLPGTDGIELVRTLRATPATARVPIVLLTARAGPESAAEGLRAGADDYVVKPFEPVELLARVHVHLELARLREYALDQAEARVAHLEKALLSNRQIGAAIGILMQQFKITQSDAFDLLRRASQAANSKLRDIADDVVLTGALPSELRPARP